MKTQKTTQHPSNFLFFDTETRDRTKGRVKGLEEHTFWFGMVWAFRYEKQKVTRSLKVRLDKVDDFYSVIARRLEPNRPLYVVAHNLGFDLTQIDFWCKSEELGMECTYAVLEDPPLFLSYKWKGCKIVFLDTFNFWKCSVADMGKSLNLHKLPMPDKNASLRDWKEYCFRDVQILANQVISLLDFLTDNELGSFGISAPSIAMNTFKKRFMKHAIYIHDRYSVLRLERSCYYGGLVNNFFIGKQKGIKLYHTDVNSLYPSVMLNNFPTKLIDSKTDLPVKQLKELSKEFGICALVSMQSKEHTYPTRYNGKLCEVTGRFRTSLCGAELIKALEHNEIMYCHYASWYEMKPIFTHFINYFWSMRQAYKKANDRVREQLVKLLMNSLYGKFGQKGYAWKEYSPNLLRVYYEMHGMPMPAKYADPSYCPLLPSQVTRWYPEGLDTHLNLRYLSGKLEMKMPTGEHSESFVAISAFVTAYARERLRKLISIAGKQQTYYCDTDSLFTTRLGYQRLIAANEVNQNELGKLKLEGESDDWQFFGPKDYQFGPKNVMKGIRKNARKISNTQYEQLQFEGLKSVLKRKGEAFITIKTINKTLKREFNKGIVLNNGWVIPFNLEEF